MDRNIITVTNDNNHGEPWAGRAFNVRIVREGDSYGLDHCLTHDEAEPMVEFYDNTNSGERFGPLGQFVSRYNATTLLRGPALGLNLDGGVEVWTVDAGAMRLALDFVSKVIFD